MTTAIMLQKTVHSGFTIERTAKRMKQVIQQSLKAAGIQITVDQWIILDQLDQKGSLSQQAIGKYTFKDAPTVTRIIDLLCEKNLTARLPDPSDRRKSIIHLTEKGKEQIQLTKPVILQVREKAYATLTADQLEQITSGLDQIFENLSSN